jgi:hypothetical protein
MSRPARSRVRTKFPSSASWNHIMQSRFVLAGSLLLLACGEDFDPGSRVTDFRVLAVQAEPAYVSPGETAHLSVLSHQPSGTPVNYAWAVCPSPREVTTEGCLEQLEELERTTGAIPLLGMGEELGEIDLEVPANALDSIPENARAGAAIGVLNVACPGSLELGGSAQGLPFRCFDASDGRELALDEQVVGMKRLFVRERDRNQNPVIERVTFEGRDWPEDEVPEVDACDENGNRFDDCSEALTRAMAAIPRASDFESGTDEFGRDFNEQLVVQYYATEGLFENEVRIGEAPETSWVARKRAAGSDVRFWFVVRDDRGGVTWATRRVRVR